MKNKTRNRKSKGQVWINEKNGKPFLNIDMGLVVYMNASDGNFFKVLFRLPLYNN